MQLNTDEARLIANALYAHREFLLGMLREPSLSLLHQKETCADLDKVEALMDKLHPLHANGDE